MKVIMSTLIRGHIDMYQPKEQLNAFRWGFNDSLPLALSPIYIRLLYSKIFCRQKDK
jgi:hypothetical protein